MPVTQADDDDTSKVALLRNGLSSDLRRDKSALLTFWEDNCRKIALREDLLIGVVDHVKRESRHILILGRGVIVAEDFDLHAGLELS